MRKADSSSRFIKAVFEVKPERFRKLLTECEFDRGLLVDTKLCPEVKVPIYWITQCWIHILENEKHWNEDEWDFRKKKADNLIIKEIFEKEFNIDFKPIDFYNLPEEIGICRDYEDDSDDWILGEDKQELIKNGYREIDLDLYCAVRRLNFERVEQLLQQGANPCLGENNEDIEETNDEIDNEEEVEIDDEDYEDNEEYKPNFDCMAYVGNEWACADMELGNLLCDNSRVNNSLHDRRLNQMDLIALAAYVSMYSLLEKYEGNGKQ